MATDLGAMAQSLGEIASELARRWAAQRVGAVQSYGQILAAYGAGRGTGRATAGALAKLAAQEAARYPADAFNLWSDYVTALARTAGVPLDHVGEPAGSHVWDPAGDSSGHRATQRPARVRTVLDIDMTGHPGSIATRDFVLENPHDATAAIGFVAGNFMDGDRDLKVRPVFDPAEFTLAGHHERKVSVSIRLDPRKFKRRQSYDANVAVSGFDDMVLRVHLTVADPD